MVRRKTTKAGTRIGQPENGPTKAPMERPDELRAGAGSNEARSTTETIRREMLADGDLLRKTLQGLDELEQGRGVKATRP